MKNKTVKMILAVAVLGICCGAYAGVKTYVAHQEQKESEEEEYHCIYCINRRYQISGLHG